MTSSLHKRLVCDFCSNNVFTFDAFQHALQIGMEDNQQGGLSYTSQNWKTIVDGEERGCGWCRILKEKILEFNSLARNGKRGPPGDEVTFGVRLRVQAYQLKVKIDIIDFEHTYTIYCHPDDPVAAAGVSGRNVVWSVGSDEAFKLASASIFECANFHSCPKFRPSELPTRVIDCLNPQRPVLVTTPKGQLCSYAALSYVWGEHQPHRTTTQNVIVYEKGIDFQLLPKTIQDAIVCTHKLHLRYLWADSLCILQDSDEDKSREIARMHHIYRDAYITIIAASASKVSRGFLQDRLNPMDDDDRLPFWCPDGRLGTISIFDDWAYTPFVDPVNERAWCFQERAMSPRALIYGTDSLQYQCATHLVNVGGSPICQPSDHRIPRLPSILTSPIPPEMLSEKDVRALHDAWGDILSKYTRRALTDRSDKLPAILAIAQTFSAQMGPGRYIAGLWERHLSSDLLWYRHSSARRAPGKYTAPSWSWAATDGQVQMNGSMNIHSVTWEILLCEAIPVTVGFPFGQVKGGRLEVKGIVRKVVWDSESVELFERKPKANASVASEESRDIHDESVVEEVERSGPPGGPASTSCLKSAVARVRTFCIKTFRSAISCIAAKHYGVPAEVTPDVNAYSTGAPVVAKDTGQLASTRHQATNQMIEPNDGSAQDHQNDSIPGLELAPQAVEGSTSRELLVSSGFTHIGYVYLDSESEDDGKTIENGFAIVVGKDGSQCLNGLLIVPSGDTEVGLQTYRRVGTFVVNGRRNSDPDAPFCDIESWMNTPARGITII